MSIFRLFGKPKKTSEFKFNEPENKAVFTCNHIILDNKPILHVEHEHDGDWQFLCGENNHSEDNAKIISLKEATELDQSLNDLSEMPIGVGVERKAIGEKWIPFKIPAG